MAGIQTGSAVAGGVAALVLASLAATPESCAEEHHACSPKVLQPMEKTTRRERNAAVRLRIEVCSLWMAVPPPLVGDLEGNMSRGSSCTGYPLETGRAHSLPHDQLPQITSSRYHQQFTSVLFYFIDMGFPKFDIFQKVNRVDALWLCVTPIRFYLIIKEVYFPLV